MGCFLVWLQVWLVLWEGSGQEKIVLNLSLPFQSVCMFLFIILQFLSTYVIIKFPDPCLAALTRHWEIYSHCRSLSLMCSLSLSLPPPSPSPFLKISLSLPLSHPLSPSLSFSESPWHCNGIRIINRVIVWNTLVCIEFLSLIFNAWLSGCWVDSTPSLHLSTHHIQTHNMPTHTNIHGTTSHFPKRKCFPWACMDTNSWTHALGWSVCVCITPDACELTKELRHLQLRIYPFFALSL